ncbi:neutral/alkaline non-lysosomal ceramidase N-terminal domain-containing protein [Tundrisphaera sp. TA3]|uniref:neutral/alkaline non-lysosomal ceramidase N-terminal domain-containing protein n=1 Tax=Tundrisphaera sp. TA3 TaxID=3435775 RepID=UPI003EC12863
MNHLLPGWLLAIASLAGLPTEGRSAAPDPLPWKAGVARVAITPEKPLWMAGYAARTRPAEGKETELYGKALAIEDAKGTRLVIVTLDLIGVPRVLRKNLERRCGEAFQLPPEGLLLNASHTHSGPEFRLGHSAGDDADTRPTQDGEAYGARLEGQLFALIGEALGGMAPARLGYTHARAGFSMNRRLPTPKGYQNSPNPDGPVDQSVPVLRIEGEGGALRAVLFGYACHNTSLALYQWNADYAGYAQEFVQAEHPGAVALFLMGCGGDQNPYPRKTVEMAQQHGRALSNAVETALSVAPRAVSGPLRAAYGEVDIDYDPVPTRDEFRRRLDSPNPAEAGHARRFLARLDAGETLPTSYPCPVQVVRLGDDLVLAALGGETCVDYSLRLKRELAGGAAVWVAGYSNDVMGYVPSRRVREEGGYEATEAMRYSRIHPGPWSPTLEEKIIAKVHELDARLGR